MSETRWIILFRSIHHVIAAEDVFKQNGIWCDLIPVPRNLSADCGMAIEFRECDLGNVQTLLSDPRVQPHGVQRPCPGGYTDVTDTVL